MQDPIIIDSLDTARFSCPECSRIKTMQLSCHKLKKKTTPVKCRCKCGHHFMVTLEKSIESTHRTKLSGTFIARGETGCSGKIIIKKLNSKGIMLKTNIEQNIIPGLKLLLEFVLDDAKQSIVRKEVVVRAKNGKYLSAEFTAQEHYDNLGPYLFFNKLYI